MQGAELVIISLLVTLTIFAFLFLFLLLRRVLTGRARRQELGEEIRSFFQYALLFALLIIVNSGISGIASRILEPADLLLGDQLQLARNTAFVVVGLPIFLGLILWAKKSYQKDPTERDNFAFTTYFALASLISLSLTLNKGYEVLISFFGERGFDGAAFAGFLTWATSLAIHYRLTRRLISAELSRAQFLLASLITLVISLTGLAILISTAVRSLFPQLEEDALLLGSNPLIRGAALFLIAAPLWFIYWIRSASKDEKSPAWLFYLLIGGIGGGLAVAIIALTAFFYRFLIWSFGDPASNEAAIHFDGAPSAIGAFSVGAISFFYHRAILKSQKEVSRNEVVHIYQYLLAGIGLITSGIAILLLIVAAIEMLTESGTLYGPQSINTILASITLLLVGGPLWLITWHQIGVGYQVSQEIEASSRTRRVYLFALFGVSAVAAIISLLTIFVRLFESLFGTGFNGSTIGEMAYSIGILVTTGVIAGYHFKILKADRSLTPSKIKSPRYILLIGPENSAIQREVENITGGVVEVLNRRDKIENTWSIDDIRSLIETNPGESQVIILEESGVRSIRVDR